MKKIITVCNNFVHFISHFSFYFWTFIAITTNHGDFVFMCMGACVCVWDQTATLGIILGLCLIFICLKQDVSLIWTIPRTLDWMATDSATLVWDYKWASLPIPFLKGSSGSCPGHWACKAALYWTVGISPDPMWDSFGKLFFRFPHWFLASITAGLVPFQCNWQVYFLSSTAELPLSCHCFRHCFCVYCTHIISFLSVSCAVRQWRIAQAGLRNPVLTLPTTYDNTFSSFLAGFYRPGSYLLTVKVFWMIQPQITHKYIEMFVLILILFNRYTYRNITRHPIEPITFLLPS